MRSGLWVRTDVEIVAGHVELEIACLARLALNAVSVGCAAV